MNPVVHSARVTEPKKQDGTMELEVGQIDLLDLPLPPRSKPAIEAAEELRVSKGPPPLPPSAPPPAEEEPPVPSLALPSPSQPHPPPAGAISARSLAFGPPKKQKSPAVQLMMGMGGATVLCVVAFFVWRATHKAAVANPPVAASAAPVPTHAFTMAPIEFTSPASSGSAPPEETASTHASTTAPVPTTTATTTTKPATTSHAASAVGTSKPPRTDELIKVEN